MNAANERPTERTSGNVARFNPWLTPSYTTYAKPANSAYSATAIALSIGVNGSTTATTNNKQAAIAGIRESLKARAMRPSSSAANSEPTNAATAIIDITAAAPDKPNMVTCETSPKPSCARYHW